MPALKNPRHERFAQELAKGETADHAYVAAGFKANRGNAATLKANQNISDRVAELQDRAAERVLVTTESLIKEAADIQTKALQAGQFSAAIGALTAKAKLAGKWVERSETGSPGDFERMTDDELERYVSAEARALGVRATGVAASSGQTGVRGKPSGLH